jgi:hypothetical protein
VLSVTGIEENEATSVNTHVYEIVFTIKLCSGGDKDVDVGVLGC